MGAGGDDRGTWAGFRREVGSAYRIIVARTSHVTSSSMRYPLQPTQQSVSSLGPTKSSVGNRSTSHPRVPSTFSLGCGPKVVAKVVFLLEADLSSEQEEPKDASRKLRFGRTGQE
jgi:hypothetical protein